MLDKPARLIIRLLFGFASDSVFSIWQTQPMYKYWDGNAIKCTLKAWTLSLSEREMTRKRHQETETASKCSTCAPSPVSHILSTSNIQGEQCEQCTQLAHLPLGNIQDGKYSFGMLWLARAAWPLEMPPPPPFLTFKTIDYVLTTTY